MKSVNKNGSALVFVVVTGVIVAIIGVALLSAAFGARLNAIRMKNETAAMMAAEAGYEQAIFWMTQQQNLLYKIKDDGDYSNTLNVGEGSCQNTVDFFSFIGSKPIYKIVSNGQMGRAERNVEVLVVQAIGGWEMGMCRVPVSTNATTPVYFANNEIIDMPIHINSYAGKYDNNIDIHISGNPTFLRHVSMGEAQHSSRGNDKYHSVMNSFNGGIDFLQPESPINNEQVIAEKIESFAEDTKSDYKITPNVALPNVFGKNFERAVQLEFFVDQATGKGKVKITNNCIVELENANTYDYETVEGSSGTRYRKYGIYGTHYVDDTQSVIVDIEDTYVSQQIGATTSSPGGQIYVDGNVIIGGNRPENNGAQEVLGNVTVVSTENIWIGDSIYVAGNHESSNNNLPSHDNPNALGLISGRVIKVVDPGKNNPVTPTGQYSHYRYEPIGIGYSSPNPNSDNRYLPDTVVIEAAVTVGGGGFGAENVPNRKEYSGTLDNLKLHGTLTEVVRGVVGLIGRDGFIKKYYLDERLLQGILPGDMWLKRKYIPAPAGWKDYSDYSD